MARRLNTALYVTLGLGDKLPQDKIFLSSVKAVVVDPLQKLSHLLGLCGFHRNNPIPFRTVSEESG